MVTEEQVKTAERVVAYYTLAASGTGAIPVPAASIAVVSENGVMIAHIASALGYPIDIRAIVLSLGIAGTLNIVGRNVFIEGAKLLSWGTGSVWALVALCALGATTAGVQTYIIGRLAIEIGKNSGKTLESKRASQVIDDAKSGYSGFVSEWKKKGVKAPD